MPPRTKRAKTSVAGSSARVEKEKVSGWERSKFSKNDHRTLKKFGLLASDGAMQVPGDEAVPNPPEGFRVIFLHFLLRGLAVPVHEFLRGLLFVYGIQLYQLTPNSILHISIFITLCECFLGIHPHWGLWKRIFYLRWNHSKNAIYNVGGVCIYVRSEAGYFDLKFADSVQGWRKKWLYVKDESTSTQQYGLAPFDVSEEILRRKSWDAEATPEEIATTESLIARIQALQNTQGEELSGVQIIAHFLRIRVQPLQARANPLWLYSGAGDAARVSEDLSVKDLEKLVRHFTSLSKKCPVPSSCRVEPFSGAHTLPTPVMKEMMDIGSRFIGFRDEADSLRKALHFAEKRANELEKKLKASKKAREKAEREAASVGELRDRLHAAENALSEKEEGIAKREAAIIARFETQSTRFSTEKIGEMYTRNQDSEEDALLDTLSVLEMNCTLARDCLKAARIAFERMFPHFFPKTELPDRFELLAKSFTDKGDPVLTHRQSSLKIGVEGCKAFSKKIIAILDPTSSASVSTAQTEVK
ncbi:hypothetical protein ACQ4PT_052641 [Festuca glaucescens]